MLPKMMFAQSPSLSSASHSPLMLASVLQSRRELLDRVRRDGPVRDEQFEHVDSPPFGGQVTNVGVYEVQVDRRVRSLLLFHCDVVHPARYLIRTNSLPRCNSGGERGGSCDPIRSREAGEHGEQAFEGVHEPEASPSLHPRESRGDVLASR